MVNQKEVSTNTLILISIIFLVFAFLVIQPINITSGVISLPIIGELDLSNTSTLIGAVVLLIVICVTIFILHRKLKNKQKLEKIPGLPGLPEPVSTIEIPTVQEIQRRQGLTEEELKQLFREIAPHIEPNPQIQHSQQPLLNLKELEFFEQQQKKLDQHVSDINKLQPPPVQKIEQKTEILLEKKEDLSELKKLITSLLNKNYTKSSIIKYLQKKGWKLSQISQVIKEINQTNLKNYVKEAVSLGYKKEQITKQLSSKGWKMQEINDVLKLPPKKISISSKAL